MGISLWRQTGLLLAGMIVFMAGNIYGASGKDNELRTVTVKSSLDGTEQKSLFYVPPEGRSW